MMPQIFKNLPFDVPDDKKDLIMDELIERVTNEIVPIGTDYLSKSLNFKELLETYRFSSSSAGKKLVQFQKKFSENTMQIT